ncbi:unnamed protein product [Prunus armeniaca]|uniref:Uncharacterized protein n=1 Tax=Prunus armeniaca TaxID=36596 RepID=A0A6J5UB37_PRUAR|nr:unnamed protein product [Prunus armeniaca]
MFIVVKCGELDEVVMLMWDAAGSIVVNFLDLKSIDVMGLPSESDLVDVVNHRNGNYAPIRDQEDPILGIFDKPLPCFGCGIGWFSLLLGFVFPVMWYYAAFLYFGKYYHRDPRERTGLQASAIAALICTTAVFIVAQARKMLASWRVQLLIPEAVWASL